MRGFHIERFNENTKVKSYLIRDNYDNEFFNALNYLSNSVYSKIVFRSPNFGNVIEIVAN